MRAIVLTVMFALTGLPAHAAQDRLPGDGDALMGCDTLAVEQRDEAGIVFSVQSIEEDSASYNNGNWVKWSKTTLFSGDVEMDWAYAGDSCRGVDQDDLADEAKGDAGLAGQLSPYLETQLMAQAMAACEAETNLIKMSQCMAASVDKAQAMVASCEAVAAGSAYPDFCGVSGPAPVEPVAEADGPVVPVDAVTGLPEAVNGVRVEDLPEVIAQAVAPEEISGDFLNHAIFRAISCQGNIEVNGGGSGYDGTYLRQPHYAFDIEGSWEAHAGSVGTSQGCSAGAMIDFRSGDTILVLQPGPGAILTRRLFNNYIGVEEQPHRMFEGMGGGGEIFVRMQLEPGTNSFRGQAVLPQRLFAPRGPNHTVQTVVNFAFAVEG